MLVGAIIFEQQGAIVMSTITLEIPESQVVAWVQQLSPVAKRAVLKALIPEMEQFEALVDYGSQRIRDLCAERGLDWDILSEEERHQLIDTLLHQA
jgi:hypothetical protein